MNGLRLTEPVPWGCGFPRERLSNTAQSATGRLVSNDCRRRSPTAPAQHFGPRRGGTNQSPLPLSHPPLRSAGRKAWPCRNVTPSISIKLQNHHISLRQVEHGWADDDQLPLSYGAPSACRRTVTLSRAAHPYLLSTRYEAFSL
jgi:hypothetical protein